MRYVVVTMNLEVNDRKISELTSDRAKASQLAEQWARDSNCVAIVAQVIGCYTRKTVWEPEISEVVGGG